MAALNAGAAAVTPIAQQGQTAAPTPTPAPQQSTAAPVAPQTPESTPENSGGFDDKTFETILQSLSDAPAQKEPEDAPIEGLSPKAQDRFRNLANGNRELREQQAQLNNALNEQAQWAQRAYAHIQQQTQQIQQLRAQLSGVQRAPSAPEPQDDVSKFTRHVKDDVLKAASSQFTPEIRKALAAVNQLQKQLTERDQQAQARERQMRYTQAVDQAVDMVFKPVMDPGEYAEAKRHISALVLAGASMRPDGDVHTAAQQLLHTQHILTRGLLKGAKARAGAKVAQSQSAPPRVETTASGTTQSVMPRLQDLRVDGRFNNHYEWMRAGSPPLNSKR